MSEKVETMGQFIELLEQSENSTLKLYLYWVHKHTDIGELARFQTAPFDVECVSILVNGLVSEMRDYIMNAAPEALYAEELSDAHTALKTLETVALQNGLTVKADQPITYSEIGVAAGVIEKVDGGCLKLTALGEQIAEGVQAQIDRAKDI